MYDCHTVKRLLYPYLDGELDIKECLRVQAHLQECVYCRMMFKAERGFLHALRNCLEVPAAPSVLKEGIRRQLSEMDPVQAEPERPRARPRGFLPRAVLAGGAALSLSLALGAVVYLYTSGLLSSASPNVVKVAVSQHHEILSGKLPLEIVSGDPARIVKWLEQKVNFPVVLPREELSSLHLVGGRMVNLRQEGRAALLVYDSDQGSVSLTMTQPTSFQAAGDGASVLFKSIRFYPTRYKGYHTLSWTDDAVSYVLVSDHKEKLAEACNICHGGEDASDFSDFKKLI